MDSLSNKRIIVGVTGGIAAYKSADLVRRLIEMGAEVRVVMTPAAMEFVRPLTFQALSGNAVHSALVDADAEAGMGHIELAKWTDLLLVAPATANTISDLVQGRADTLLGAIYLAVQAPTMVAPAMNQAMWHHPATVTNLEALSKIGLEIIEPDSGSQACGDIGVGRMQEPAQIAERVSARFRSEILRGRKLVITAGPTREAMDPVRYISNYSSGKMGYALANAAVEAGAEVTLISGPVNISSPQKCLLVNVTSAEDMYQAAKEACAEGDIFISAAAVVDYRCIAISGEKIKKTKNLITMSLERNVDIVRNISNLKPNLFVVGFAAETENLIENAKIKLRQKKIDAIIANDVSRPDIGFNADDNEAYWITSNVEKHLKRNSKSKLSREIIQLIAAAISKHKTAAVCEERIG